MNETMIGILGMGLMCLIYVIIDALFGKPKN